MSRIAVVKWSREDVPVVLSPLGDFVDGVVQSLEDRRAGLKDDALAPADVERFCADHYQAEEARLRELLGVVDPQLPPARREALAAEVDRLVRGVILPAYARLAAFFTVRERNDFFITHGTTRLVERAAWVVGGLAAGGFIVWAPFIPLWSKDWIWLCGVAGFFVPELRRVWAWRRYEHALNALVQRADRELERLREAYLVDDGGADAAAAARIEP
jgi:hypothetical protein